MRLLALDLGTTTGFALLDGQAIISGSMSFKPQRFEGGGMRYLRFRRWLDEIRSGGEAAHRVPGGNPSAYPDSIDEIVFEEVRRHKGVDAAHAYGGFLAHLTAWCEDNSVPYAAKPVGDIKGYATGKRNAGKPAMIAAVTSWGYKPGDDNEADAIALLHLKMSELGVGPRADTPAGKTVNVAELLG